MEILRIADGTVLAGASGALDGPASRFEWYPTRLPGMTGQDGFLLRTSAADLVARGSEVLIFETDAPVAAELRTVECRDEGVAWTGRYRIAYDGERVLVGTRIRLVNRHGPVSAGGDAPPPAGKPLSAPVLAFIREESERFLSGRFGLVREGCRLGMGCSCVKPVVELQVDFVERDEDHAVDLYSGEPRLGSARGSAVAWTLTRLWQGQWAHAVGHLLGWLDDTRARSA